jgi:hypothetical protein
VVELWAWRYRSELYSVDQDSRCRVTSPKQLTKLVVKAFGGVGVGVYAHIVRKSEILSTLHGILPVNVEIRLGLPMHLLLLCS